MQHKPEIGNEDLEQILNLVNRLHGFDFSHYARASLVRRLQKLMADQKLETAASLCTRLETEPEMFQPLMEVLTVNVTEMFRDQVFFTVLREKILPTLASYPSINIWHAGCATGEEVYSMCILLQEAGLLQRSRVYATDLNPVNIEKAVSGIMPLHYMKTNTLNYLRSGGKQDFADYYTALYDKAIIKKEFREKVVFQQHNLVTDRSFNEFQLILCRNVLIYFDRFLQNQSIKLFYESLSPLGYLALGMKETLHFSELKNGFIETTDGVKLYRKNT